MAVTGSVSMTASFAEDVTSGISPNDLTEQIARVDTYAAGTGSRQVDVIYSVPLTLAAAPLEIDLTNLIDPAGNAISFARVREFIPENVDQNAGHDVLITQGASNGWAPLPASGGLPLRYNSASRVSDPVSTGANNGNVVTGTSKTVKFDPGANTVNVAILIAGCTVA